MNTKIIKEGEYKQVIEQMIKLIREDNEGDDPRCNWK